MYTFCFVIRFDARGQPSLGEGKHTVSDGTQVGGRQRALFMSVNDPPVLSLEGVRESDAGMYVCRVDFRISPTKYTKVNLTIIGELRFLIGSRTRYVMTFPI